MNSQDAKKIIATFPDSPGVYFFKRGSRILYIGKATSLPDRVRSYFAADIATTRGPLITKMLGEFDTLEFIQTDSVLEALILEAHLIKKHQPEANIQEKDDKSFNFVVITKEEFPRVLVVRGRELLVSQLSKQSDSDSHRSTQSSKHGVPLGKLAESFGPFTNGAQLREALKIVRRLFPYRDEKCVPYAEQLEKIQKKKSSDGHRNTESVNPAVGAGQIRACFNRQIGLCPGVCTGEISAAEYKKQIKNITLFFEGNKKAILKNLEKEMKDAAKAREFERAGMIKRQMFALQHIQDVSLIKESSRAYQGRSIAGAAFRIESYDIAHMSGKNVVGVMTVVEDGEVKKSDYRKFKIRDNPGVNDTKALSEVLNRRLAHIEWPLPSLIVVDGGVAQKNAIEKIITSLHLDIPVVSVVKDDRHKPREILGDPQWLTREREILLSNAEAHRYGIAYHKKLRGKLN